MESIWTKTCSIPPRDALPGDMETEIAVIGAGMAGVLIAAALERAGRRVLVLEAQRISGGQTCRTTAKITAQHGMFAQRLIFTQGEDRARQYVSANLSAVRRFGELIRAEGIDCDYRESTAYVYGSAEKQLRLEAQAQARLGLPASYIPNPQLPDPALGAVGVEQQAQFHPLKFLCAISRSLTIYEHSPVQRVEDNVIITARGRVRAEKIVFACHYPFVNFPGLYFARMHQERSYVLALENAAVPEGMWVGAGEGGFSFRSWNGLLLLGGKAHRTGENVSGGKYAALRAKAEEWFPHSREVAHWSAQDCMTADGLPYIGRYAESRPDWYVATGFQKWGMSSSMVSAVLLRDLLRGKPNPYARVFDPGRLSWKAASGIVSEGWQAAKGLGKNLFQIPSTQAAELTPGHGGIVFLRGKKAGVFRNEKGEIHAVKLRCPHLGCQVEWNPDECSWDCPCHGSRFDHRGGLISGPAQERLGPGAN